MLQALAAALTVLPVWLLLATVEGAIFSVAWIVFIVLTRRYVRGRRRSDRASIDAAVIGLCIVGFPLGGLYWVPAAAVFALGDWVAVDGEAVEPVA